ncbi:hypothetical protein OSTOST_03593 [Ostertagia ostertagi]
MRLLLIFELFLALALAADGDITPATVTSTSSSPTTKAPATGGAITAAPASASTTSGTPTSPVSTGTKGTGSTVPGGNTVPVSSTTVLQTSTSAGTTTTTLPKVDVEYVEFKRKCDVDGDCEYTLVAPRNDQRFLATEKSVIDEENGEVSDISSKIQQFQDTINNSTDDAQKEMQELTRKLQNAQKLLTLYQTDLQQIQKNLDDVEYQLQFSSLYIDMLAYNPQQCYAKCLIPPNATSGPSTTPSPCSGYVCHNGGRGCETDPNNTPHCQCPGNLDGYQHSCSDSGIIITTTPSDNIPFYSPGFYGPDSSNFTAPIKDILCSWTLQSSSGENGYDATKLNFTNLDSSTSTLTFYTANGAAIQATNTFTLRKLESVLKESPITIEFTAKSGSTSSFFFDMTEL